MAVFTLAGEKIGTQKSNWNRLLLLYKSHKLYKENKYIKTIKYCSHFTLFPPSIPPRNYMLISSHFFWETPVKESRYV